MASSPQKSPSSPKSPSPRSPPSRKKDDSFLGKLGGTLARRKKAKEGVIRGFHIHRPLFLSIREES